MLRMGAGTETTGCGSMTCQPKLAIDAAPWASVTVTWTVCAPTATSVPLMVPVAALMASPGGNPLAAYVNDADSSEAMMFSVTTCPGLFTWSGGVLTTGGRLADDGFT